VRALGIDLSHHNGTWDPSVMDPRIRFVIHKATEGATFRDSRYDANRTRLAGSNRQDVVWGAYHVLRETSPIDDQARHFVALAALQPGDVAACDLETKHAKALIETLGSAAKARAAVVRWLGRVETETGCTPLLYVSERGLKHLSANWREPLDEVVAWPLWYCSYLAAPAPAIAAPEKLDPPTPSWLLWQFTSKQLGSWAGVSSEHVDVNVCRDLAELHRAAVPKSGAIEALPSERVFRESEVRRAMRAVDKDFARAVEALLGIE
jgi:lysozyme